MGFVFGRLWFWWWWCTNSLAPQHLNWSSWEPMAILRTFSYIFKTLRLEKNGDSKALLPLEKRCDVGVCCIDHLKDFKFIKEMQVPHLFKVSILNEKHGWGGGSVWRWAAHVWEYSRGRTLEWMLLYIWEGPVSEVLATSRWACHWNSSDHHAGIFSMNSCSGAYPVNYLWPWY